MSATLTSDSLFPRTSAVPEAVSLPLRANNANDEPSFFGRLIEAIGASTVCKGQMGCSLVLRHRNYSDKITVQRIFDGVR